MLDQLTPPAIGSGRETDETLRATPPVTSSGFVSIDVVVEWRGDRETLAHKMRAATAIGDFRLATISGPREEPAPEAADQRTTAPRWRCRFTCAADAVAGEREVPWLLSVIGEHMRWIHVEKVAHPRAPGAGTHPAPGMAA